MIKFADKPPLTVDQIKQIWNEQPDVNIALKTDKFFVIDVDRHNGVDGMKSIKALKHDEWFKDTLTETTAHNGYHFFFQKPVNDTITQFIGFLPGVNIKAHPNNYVVVAPSKLGDKLYKWANHLSIKTAPKGLIELIKSKQMAKTTSLKTVYSNINKSKTAQLFETVINGLGDVGGRNDRLASFVGGLLYRGVDPYISADLATIANEHTSSPYPQMRLIRRLIQ